MNSCDPGLTWPFSIVDLHGVRLQNGFDFWVQKWLEIMCCMFEIEFSILVTFRGLPCLISYMYDNLLSVFCHFNNLRSIFCHFDILPLRYFAIDILSVDILPFDIMRFDILHFRYFALSVFCDSIFCDFDILRFWYFAFDICVRYFAIWYSVFRYFVRNPFSIALWGHFGWVSSKSYRYCRCYASSFTNVRILPFTWLCPEM